MAVLSLAALALPCGGCARRSCVAVHICNFCNFCNLQPVEGDEIKPIRVDRRKLPENKRRREHEEYVKGGRGGGSQSRVGRKAGNPLVKLNDVLKGVL